MDIVVDGIIFALQKTGGISRVFRNQLPLVCDLDPEVRVTLCLDRRLLQAAPTHRSIRPAQLAWPPQIPSPVGPSQWLWTKAVSSGRRVSLPMRFSSARSCIWHSTFFTRPLVWRGPEVVTVYDMVHERYARDGAFRGLGSALLRRRKRECVAAADAIIAISAATRDDLCEWYGIPADRVCVIHIGYDRIFRVLDAARGIQPDGPAGTPFVLYVGTREPYKGFHVLLDGYARWPHRESVSLVVVGKPWSETENRDLAERRLTSRVTLLPYPDDSGLCQLYNQAQALVVPSFCEGFGIPLLEAMACGCPLVASRIPSTVEVAGDIPSYFEPGDGDGIGAALSEVCSEGRQSARTRRGLARVSMFSWEDTARKTLSVYRSLS